MRKKATDNTPMLCIGVMLLRQAKEWVGGSQKQIVAFGGTLCANNPKVPIERGMVSLASSSPRVPCLLLGASMPISTDCASALVTSHGE